MVFCIVKKQRRNKVLLDAVVEKLKQLRKERNLTQEVVTFDTELNISRIEMGTHSITLTTLADLCKYYGVTLEEFFKGIKIE